MSQNARMEVVLNVVLPVLLGIVHAKHSVLAVRQEWRFEHVCVSQVCHGLHRELLRRWVNLWFEPIDIRGPYNVLHQPNIVLMIQAI